MGNRRLKILLAGPRGFCAGVDRAITIVEKALEKHGAPVYVRHEIVHNKFVVQTLEKKGAVFVKELDEVPKNVPVVFSAHGVPKSVPSVATAYNMEFLDATCPLVSRVHRSVERNYQKGLTTILIGHQGHPEVIGTMGQLPKGATLLVETVEDVQRLQLPDDIDLSWSTQTTLSVEETSHIIAALKEKFPQIIGPQAGDICYATTNRQQAVRKISQKSDALLIIGAPNSSNSRRLVDVGLQEGLEKSMLVQRARDIDWAFLDGVYTLGISAGASAPEILVDEVVNACAERFDVQVEEVISQVENVSFPLPRKLR